MLAGLELSAVAPYEDIDVRHNYMADTSAITGRSVPWDSTGGSIRAVFAPQKIDTPPAQAPTPALPNPFADVKESDWFYGSVMHAYRSGLFGGTSATTFSPSLPMTRAMLARVLARLDKANLSLESGAWNSGFTDVAEDDWYHSAVMWAADRKIVSGVGGGRFGPNEPVTREQMAAMLVNYFLYKGIDLKPTAAENAFADEGKISDWAKDAVERVQRAGIIEGKSGNMFDPKGNATRAEVAAIFSRLPELLEK